MQEVASIDFLSSWYAVAWHSGRSADGVVWEAVHPGDPGHTFTPRNPLVRAGEMCLESGRRIDYVMVRCGLHGPALNVVDYFLAFDEPVDGVWATDHFGVVADLHMPARPPGSW